MTAFNQKACPYESAGFLKTARLRPESIIEIRSALYGLPQPVQIGYTTSTELGNDLSLLLRMIGAE